MGFVIYAPIAILYFKEVTGSYALGMSIFSVEMISAACFEIPTGVFSDRIGRKRTVVLGSIAAVINMLLYVVATSYSILFVGAIMAGLARSFYSGNNTALLHDTMTQLKQEGTFADQYGKTSSNEQAALGIAAIIGGLIGMVSLRFAVVLSVIPQLICLILSLLMIEPTVHTKESGNIFVHLKSAIGEFFSNKKLRLLNLATVTTYALTESTFQFRSAFYATLWPVWAIGAAQAISNICATISFHFSGRVLKRLGTIKSLIYGNIYGRTMNIIGTAFPTVFSPLLMSSTSIIYGVLSVAKESLLQAEYKPAQRATMGSLNSLGGSLLFGIIAFLLGTIGDTLSPAKALLFSQFFTAATIIFYLRIAKYHKDKP